MLSTKFLTSLTLLAAPALAINLEAKAQEADYLELLNEF